MRRWIYAGGGLVLAVMTAVLLLRSGGEESLEVIAPPTGPNWIPGAKQSYELRISSHVRMSLPGSPGPQELVQRISGILNLRVFDVEGSVARVGFQLDPVHYTLNGQIEEGIEEGISAPFLVQFGADGRPGFFEFPAALEDVERILLEEGIRTFQVVFPEEASRAWSTTEEHATGRYLAHYESRDDGSLHKRKTLYTRVALPFEEMGAPEAHLPESLAIFRFSPGTAWLRAATVQERLIATAGAQRISEAEVEAELSLVATVSDREIALFEREPAELLRGFARATSLPGEGPPPEVRLAELVEQLRGSPDQRIAKRQSLEEALRQQPELAFRLLETLLDPALEDDAAATLLHALERAGTPEAQEALLRVMEDPAYDRRNRTRATIALGGVENAGDETITALLHVGRSSRDPQLANTALLALGNIGNTLREADAARADGLRRTLSSNLRGSRDSEEAGVMLKAMGNMRDPELGEAITPYLAAPSPFVRASAARALGNSQAEGAIEQLTERLWVEENAVVRGAIVEGLAELPSTSKDSLAAVDALALDEPDPTTRYQMARYLGEHVAIYPESHETLRQLAVSDSSLRVRKLAADAAYPTRVE